MAGGNTGELWFEMGVRDKVASAMEKDIALSKQLQGSIDDVLNSYKDLSKLSASASKVSFISNQSTREIRKQIDAIGALYMRIKELQGTSKNTPKNWQDALNIDYKKYGSYRETMDMYAETLRRVQAELKQLSADGYDVGGFNKQLASLLATYEKFAALQPVDLGKKLGLEHIKGYTGPSKAASDNQWAAMKHQAEVQEVAGEAAKRHQRKLEELTNAFAQHDAQVAKSQRMQDGENRARQKSTAALREQAKELVKTRMEMLRAQSSDLSKLLSMGRGKLGAEQYDAVRNALRAVREEMRQIEGVMQRMNSLSTRSLFSVGRGKTLDFAPLISSFNSLVRAENDGASAARNLQEANRGLMASYDKVTQSSRQTMSTLSMLRQQAGYYFSLFGAKTLFENVVKIGGQFEYQHVALQNIIGDAEKATAIFSQLKDLAVESPKTFMELTSSAKQLSAYQIPVNELYDTTKRLSDLSVGLGVDMNRLILAYGQVRSAAVLRGQELRQFTEAGIPLVQALAQKFTELNGKVTSTADVFKLIQTRAVSFEMVKEVLWDMTNQGGQFFNMQSTMADTLYGKWQKLADIWQITLGDMANTNFGGFKPFHALIDTLVFAARNLSNLMPILTGMMTAKGFAFIRSSAQNQFSSTGLEKNIAQAQKLQAIELRRAYVNGEISKKIYQQRMAMNANKDSYYMLLAAEGRISNYQIRRLIEEKKITAEKIRQGLANGTLIQQEAVQLRLLMQQNAQGKLGGMNGIARGIGGSILSFMGGWWGVALGVAGAAWSIYSNYKQKAEEEEAQAKERIKSAQELWKNADTTLRAAVNEGASESAVNNMSQWLKENAASWDMVSESMKNNDGTAKTLEERYNILKDAIEGVKNASEQAAKGSNPFEGKEGNSVASDLKDAQTELDNFQKVLNDKVALNYSRFKKAMDEVIAASPNFKKALEMEGATNSLTRQMEILQRFPLAFKQFRGIFSTEMNMLVPINEIRDAWTDFQTELQDAHDNLPNLAEKIEADMRNKWDDINFKNLTYEQREYLMKLYKDWLEKNNITSTAVLKDLDDKFYNKRYNIRLVFTAEQGNDLNAFQKDALGYLGKGTTPFKSGAVQRWTQGGSAYAASNMAQSEIDTAYNEWQRQEKMIKNLKKQGKEVSEEAESLKRSLEANYNDLVSAAWEGLGYQYEGKGLKSNKTPKAKGGGSKTDVVAKAMRERVSVLKDAYSEYKKWTELLGKEGALAKVKESGIFGSLFADKDFKGLGDYRGELQRIKSKLSPDKSEQRKVIESIDKILLGMDYDDAKEQAEKDLSLLQKSMEQMSRKWNTYKNIYDKTGNKENAMQLVFGNTENLRRNIESAKDYWKSMLDSVAGGLSSSELEDMTDKELSEKFGETWKTVKTYRDEYIKAFRASADEEEKIYLELLEASMTFADKMAKIESQRAKDIKAAKGDQNLIYAANQKANKAISEINLEQLKDSINWDVVFGNLETYTKDVLINVRKQLKEYLNMNRKNMDVKQIKTVTDAVNKLNKEIANQSGLFGGLTEARKNLADAIENERIAQIEYNFAVMRFGENSQQAYNALMKLRAAQGDVVVAEGNQNDELYETLNKISSITNAVTNLGKNSKASLSDVGNTISAIASLFGKSGSTYGQLIAAIFSLLDAIGEQGFDRFLGNILSGVGGAVGGIVMGVGNIFGTILGDSHAFDFLKDIWDGNWRYEKAKQEYEGLVSTWEKLTDAKTKYFEEGWGNEASNAAREAKELMDAQIEATRIIARERLDAGATAGSHSYGYRMWQGSYGYNKQNWKDVAKEAEKGMMDAGLGDVVFNSMEDMTRMTADQLEYLMKNYTGLWANMDGDFKDYLEKLIDYYRNADEQLEKIKEKLTGWNFKSLSDSWANALSNMSNSATNLYEDFEDGLREAIINAMVSNIYSDEMKNLVNGLADAAQNELYTDVAGNVKKHTYDNEGNILDTDVLSEYTKNEYDNMKAVAENLAEREAASRDLLADLYGWTDKNSGESSVSQVLSGLSENDQSLLMSYVNAIRGDVSVLRTLAEQESGTLTGMNATVQLQLRELEAISVNTRRNADSAEFIESFCRGLRDGEYTIKVK